MSSIFYILLENELLTAGIAVCAEKKEQSPKRDRSPS